jgi:hypothetical protein
MERFEFRSFAVDRHRFFGDLCGWDKGEAMSWTLLFLRLRSLSMTFWETVGGRMDNAAAWHDSKMGIRKAGAWIPACFLSGFEGVFGR